MPEALLTAVSGLQASQTMLDVVGNNLANMNTVGFKSQSTQFEDLVYQSLTQGTLGQTNDVGTNPSQVGLGVNVGAVTTNFTNGSLETTGVNTDIALQGNGFFVLNDGTGDVYTRDGSFSVNANGVLVDTATGSPVQRVGTVGETGSTPFQTPGNEDLLVPYGIGIPATPTANITYQGNLSTTLTTTAGSNTYSTAIQVYDSQGTGHSLTATFTKTANAAAAVAGNPGTPAVPDTYEVSLAVSGGSITAGGSTSASVGAAVNVGTVTFNPNGSLLAYTPASAITMSFASDPSASQTIKLDMGTANESNGLTEYGNTSSAAAISQDGASAGSLQTITIASDGTVTGNFTNSQNLALGQIAVATFANPSGLERVGDNAYTATTSSGTPVLGTAGSGSAGSIQAGALEQSNVDEGTEFTNLILAQQAYQINAKVITTADQTIQALLSVETQ